MTAWILPGVVCAILVYGAIKKVDIANAFFAGAREGLQTALSILPPLLLLLTAIGMLRASGGLQQIADCVAPLFRMLGIPPEITPLALLRPLSGSGSLAALEDALQTYGADSAIGRTAAVMMASTETTLYTTAVYLGAVDVKRGRHTIPCALLGDVTAVLVSAWIVAFLF